MVLDVRVCVCMYINIICIRILSYIDIYIYIDYLELLELLAPLT